VHWPWCKAKCPYCDFNSHATPPEETHYIEGVVAELRGWGAVLEEPLQGADKQGFAWGAGARQQGGSGAADGGNGRHGAGAWDGFRPLPAPAPEHPGPLPRRRLASVFFGGGTPSLMAPASVAKVLEACAAVGVLDGHTEITVECNPTSFDDARPARAMLADLKACGVNRVSLGVQGLKDEWLRFLGREHSARDALGTLDAAQEVFDNVNADVIYGLPGQGLADWRQQLESLAGRGLAHISAYQLTIEPNTRFYTDVKRGLWQPVDGDSEAAFFEDTQAVLAVHGYENYEISNFAKPGRACVHNRHVWRYGDYVGVGAGAHGRLTLPGGTRLATQVVRQPDGYLRRIRDGLSTLAGADTVPGRQAVQEALFLGLRLREGVDVGELEKRFGKAACDAAVNWVEHDLLTTRGVLERDGTTLRLTPRGWPLLNGVLTRLLDVAIPQTTDANTPTESKRVAYTTGLRVSIE